MTLQKTLTSILLGFMLTSVHSLADTRLDKISSYQDNIKKTTDEITTTLNRIVSSKANWSEQEKDYRDLEVSYDRLMNIYTEFSSLEREVILQSLITEKRKQDFSIKIINNHKDLIKRVASKNSLSTENLLTNQKNPEIIKILLNARDLFKEGSEIADKMKSN